MKIITIIFCASVATFAATAQQSLSDLTDKLFTQAQLKPQTSLAVLPLENKIKGDDNMGQAVSEMLVSLIQAKGQAQLVERMQLKHAMDELALSASGFIDENKALSLGKGVSAPVILVGSVSDLMGERVVNVRLLETETGKVLGASSATMGASDLGEMKKAVFGEAGQVSAALFRSAIVPGWGQFYTDHSVRGTISLVSFFGTLGYGVMSAVAAADKKKDYDNFGTAILNGSAKTEYCKIDANCQSTYAAYSTQKQNDLYKKYSDQTDFANLVFAISGGIWALNMIDAYFAGAEQKQKVQLYFSALPTSGGVSSQLAFKVGF